jgi:hypothetical protein
MLADARDLVGIIALEKRLGLVREGLADRIVAGQTVTAQEIAAAEQEAQATVKRDFYNVTSRKIIKPTQAGMSDDQDYDARGQRLAENALWFSHRGLLAIPLVGDPAFADADAALGTPNTPKATT